jgi:hypothetical protein
LYGVAGERSVKPGLKLVVKLSKLNPQGLVIFSVARDSPETKQ